MNPELTQISNALAEAAEKAGAATVLVNARRRLPASGIALTSDTILTASHVIEDEENIQVILADGSKLSAELLGYDPASDLAVLKLEKAVATPADTEDQARVGELVLALGRPWLSGIEASLGVVCAKGGPVHTRRGGLLEAHLRTDAEPLPGFSGGPLVNASGKIIGINTSGLGFGNSIAIPIGVASKIAEMIAEHGSVQRGFLGISGQAVPLPQEGRQALGREQESGLLIIGLEENAPAAAGGMMLGDILVGLNGETIESHDQLLAQLAGTLIGKEIEVEVLRGGQPKTLKVVVGERPDSGTEDAGWRPGRPGRGFLRHRGFEGHHPDHPFPHRPRGKHRRRPGIDQETE